MSWAEADRGGCRWRKQARTIFIKRAMPATMRLAAYVVAVAVLSPATLLWRNDCGY